MAFSLALIIFLGLLCEYALAGAGIPGLTGMLVVGVALGPYVLNLIDPALLEVSADLRMIALIVILLRAGLRIKRQSINKMGRTALLLSSIPSTMEGLAVTVAAHYVFGMGYTEAALMGFILAAVSPAVVVPSMLKAMDRGLGTDKGVPTLVLASSSLDNAYVIVVFSTVMGMQAGAGFAAARLLEVPISIALGTVAGGAGGYMLHLLFKRFGPRATKKTMMMLGAGILMMWVEYKISASVPFSGLLAVMAIGLVILEVSESAAHAISAKLAKIWIGAEILLFVLVGAQVNTGVALKAGLAGLGVIAIGLVARSMGTYICVMGAGLNPKERLFCVISYIPKATVQAAIGAVPLAAGVPGAEVILAMAVLSIVVTAPIGAIAIEYAGPRLLTRSQIK